MEIRSAAQLESQVSLPESGFGSADGSDVLSSAPAEYFISIEAQMQSNADSGSDKPITEFRSSFTDCMEMYADAKTVAHYLDAHQDWFRRCAAPMEAEALGETGYALTLGRFGSLGYNLEPKIGLDLLPQDEGVYRIRTIEVPDYQPIGYSVDFQAALELNQHQPEDDTLPVDYLTRVEWVLDLGVSIEFPRFINMLPQQVVKGTGDRLLHQIVRQISRRLTHRVQQDFHESLGLPLPKAR